jgi:ribonuclease III
MLCAELLFSELPDASEGELTRVRTHLVDESALSSFARELDLSDALIMGAGELRSGGFRRESILADVFEALVAVNYLQGGLDQAQRFLLPFLQAALPAAQAKALQKDGKTQLQEYLQERSFALPTYTLLDATGPEHNRHFNVQVGLVIGSNQSFEAKGSGSSLKRAEQAAASAVLVQLKSRLSLEKKEKA